MDLRLMMVDEHPAVRESLQFLFSTAKFTQVREVVSHQEALDAARDQEVDLVLLDVALRHQAGLQTLRQIKAAAPSLPVLVHTFDDNPSLLSRCFHLGACGYLLKGLDKNELLDAVRRAAQGERLWAAEQLKRIRQTSFSSGPVQRADERSLQHA